MTKEDLTKKQLLELIEEFEYYPAVTEEDDEAYILAYLDDELCSISQEDIQEYINKHFKDELKRVKEEVESLTGEKYDSLNKSSFKDFLDANNHLTKEISYTLGFIQSSIEIAKLKLDDKLESFVSLMHERFEKF